MINPDDIASLARTLGSQFNADAVILFGSHARQETHLDSDVDLLVVMPEEESCLASDLYLKMRQATAGRWPIPLDLVIRSRTAVERWKNVPYSLIHEALKEGKVLYARRPF